jgi:hypothetical protein
MNNVTSMNKDKVFSKEGELMERLNILIAEYDGEVSFVSVLGILELKKIELFVSQNNVE